MRLPFVTGLILFPILHEFENGIGHPLQQNGTENQNGCDSLEDLGTDAEILDSLDGGMINRLLRSFFSGIDLSEAG